MNQKGLTLLEVIFLLVIVGASIPPLLVAFSRIQERNMMLMPATTASHLARDQMEELIQGKSFADVNDIQQTSFEAPFDQYRYELQVDYVQQSNLDLPVGEVTNLKRVQIMVTSEQMPDLNVSMATLVANQ